MTVSEKVAYVKGLFEGMNLDPEASPEAKLLSAVIGVLEEVGRSIGDLEVEIQELNDGVDQISEDLEDVEDLVYGGDEDEDGDFFQIDCPTCGEELTIDADALEAGFIECPSCREKFALDFSDEEDESDGDEN